MQKKNQYKVTMVNYEQLNRYPGFKTQRAIKLFCTRYHVNCFWWQPPQGTKKVLMVDEQNFRRCWSEFYGARTFTPRKTTTARTTRPKIVNRTRITRMSTRTQPQAKRTQTIRKTNRRAA
jgi:hypothetical protein